jgi:hypothetical protein
MKDEILKEIRLKRRDRERGGIGTGMTDTYQLTRLRRPRLPPSGL